MRAQRAAAAREVIVIGAGAIGLSIAWRTAQRGMDTLVLDAERPAYGATGVAAGMLAPVTEADFGEDELLHLNLAAAERWPEFANELSAASGLSTGFRETGTLVVAADRDDAESIDRLADLHSSLGLR